MEPPKWALGCLVAPAARWSGGLNSARMSTDFAHYYADRAGEYDRVYEKPERQADLARLRETLVRLLKGRRVLEVACGTGYWTEPVGQVAELMLATDISPEVLSIARRRCGGVPCVRFMEADAYTLAGVQGEFTAAFAAFWWSHVPKSRIPAFLSVLHSKLPSDALVVLADNLFVPGSSTPISRSDQEGNTHQQRRLADGRSYEVLKNFPDEAEIRRYLADHATQVEFEALTYYWWAAYRIRRPA
jgi:demethylmenaquinone methyltransferase/2-methoxy-6-polyprenyl-1,4-benzoquinol methylase